MKACHECKFEVANSNNHRTTIENYDYFYILNYYSLVTMTVIAHWLGKWVCVLSCVDQQKLGTPIVVDHCIALCHFNDSRWLQNVICQQSQALKQSIMSYFAFLYLLLWRVISSSREEMPLTKWRERKLPVFILLLDEISLYSFFFALVFHFEFQLKIIEGRQRAFASVCFARSIRSFCHRI